ncbi:trypsin alpha-like isoform X2 [Choristoneura fumiferana]|uniref:trypsin alpha-like isoform X2 n=1 Tax=Choristoneura fumiferana TaxID=7141 RepID=UPI003D1592DB
MTLIYYRKNTIIQTRVTVLHDNNLVKMLCKIIKILKITFIVVVISYCLEVECGRVKRVVGGAAVECGAQPRVASLRNASTSQHLCGATVLTAEFASTAAHCVRADTQYLLQLDNWCGEPPKTRVLEVITHELYDKYSRTHDIALLRTEPVDWPGINENVLPEHYFGATGECTVYGYGVKNVTTNELSETLMAANVRIISLDECVEALGQYVAPAYDSGMTCAVGNGVDTCDVRRFWGSHDVFGPIGRYQQLWSGLLAGRACSLHRRPRASGLDTRYNAEWTSEY